jgi:hypothetical protein
MPKEFNRHKGSQLGRSNMRSGGLGLKYADVVGYGGGVMEAPGAAKSTAIQEMKRSAGGSGSQKKVNVGPAKAEKGSGVLRDKLSNQKVRGGM